MHNNHAIEVRNHPLPSVTCNPNTPLRVGFSFTCGTFARQAWTYAGRDSILNHHDLYRCVLHTSSCHLAKRQEGGVSRNSDSVGKCSLQYDLACWS
jgi:hypothetical protein